MIGFEQVGAFMGGDIVHDLIGGHDQAPAIADLAHGGRRAKAKAPRRLARTPAPSCIHNRHGGHGGPKGGGMIGGALRQNLKRFGPQGPHHRTGKTLIIFTAAGQDQFVPFLMPMGTGTRGSSRLKTAGLAQDGDPIARRERQGRRQGLKLLTDPFSPLLGKGHRTGKMFETGRNGDDLAVGRV